MASILKKALLLVLVGLFVSCFMLGCTESTTSKNSAGTGSSMSTGETMSAPSPMSTEMKEQPKSSWGSDTRQNIMTGQ